MRPLTQRECKIELSRQTPSTQAAFLSLSIKRHQLLVATITAANRARIIAWSHVRDDIGLINQVCALKTGSGIQKSRWAVRLPFQSFFNKLAVFEAAPTQPTKFKILQILLWQYRYIPMLPCIRVKYEVCYDDVIKGAHP